MKIKPARGYVLIQAEEAEEVSAGGVLLPERVKDMPQKGKVLAVGEGLPSVTQRERKVFPATPGVDGMDIENYCVKVTEPPPCKIGDTVIFKRFVDNKIKEDGKELLIVKFEDILGVYED